MELGNEQPENYHIYRKEYLYNPVILKRFSLKNFIIFLRFQSHGDVDNLSTQARPEEFPANEDCEYLWRDNSTEHVHFSTFEKISSETGKDLHCGSAPVVDF